MRRRPTPACLATTPTPASPQITPLPTENTLDCTATPTSPVCGSKPTMEKVATGGHGDIVGVVGNRVVPYVNRRCKDVSDIDDLKSGLIISDKRVLSGDVESVRDAGGVVITDTYGIGRIVEIDCHDPAVLISDVNEISRYADVERPEGVVTSL